MHDAVRPCVFFFAIARDLAAAWPSAAGVATAKVGDFQEIDFVVAVPTQTVRVDTFEDFSFEDVGRTASFTGCSPRPAGDLAAVVIVGGLAVAPTFVDVGALGVPGALAATEATARACAAVATGVFVFVIAGELAAARPSTVGVATVAPSAGGGEACAAVCGAWNPILFK